MPPRGSRRLCGEYASLLGEADDPNSLSHSHHSLQATYDKSSRARCAVSDLQCSSPFAFVASTTPLPLLQTIACAPGDFMTSFWDHVRDRCFSLLCNFMDLTSPVQLADQRTANKQMIRDSEMLMSRYLNTTKALFKDTNAQPLHHAGGFLWYCEPNHSVQDFGGERYLKVLGLQNVNNKSGSYCAKDIPL